MLKSYLKIAVRSIVRNKLTTFINVFGLGLSMCVGLMIMIRLQDDLGYDKFHPNEERIYRVTSGFNKSDGEKWKMASTPLPLHDALSKNNGGISAVVNVYPALSGKVSANGKELNINAAFTEPSFFKVFGFRLKTGNASSLFLPNTIVLSSDVAANYFGTANAIGQVLHFDNGADFLVTGIMQKPPGKSHLNFDAYASYASVAGLEKSKTLSQKANDWFAFNAAYTYLLIDKNSTAQTVQQQLNSVAANINKLNTVGKASFSLQPLADVSPTSGNLNNDNGYGYWGKTYFEMGMALLILLAACFNYTNLTIARALTRAKEVGIRKIAGAKRYQLFVQYVLESVVLSMLALGFAYAVLALILKYAPFNDDYEFIPSTFTYNSRFVCWSLLYALFTGLLAGTSPAWILSAFKPLRILKNLSTARLLGNINIQKALIVFQYTLSLIVIIFLLAFYKQFAFMAKQSPGFITKNILVVPLNGLNRNVATQTIQQVNGVESVAAMSSSFTKHAGTVTTSAWLTDKKDALPLNYYYADNKFISNMHFGFIAGNNFPSPAEGQTEHYIILNEKALHAFGLKNAHKAIGSVVHINDSTLLTVSGVIKDFHYQNAGSPIQPMAFRTKDDAYDYLYITTQNGNKEELKHNIENALQASLPGYKAGATWLADDLAKNNSQAATIALLGFFGFIALAIASLGLLGLVIYNVEVRSKEISIRKIIGASEKQVINMLSKSFIKMLFIAGLIAMPLGWILSALFLHNFSVQTSFGIGNVLACFAFLLMIGLFTIISQTYKAAIANPVNSLRSE